MSSHMCLDRLSRDSFPVICSGCGGFSILGVSIISMYRFIFEVGGLSFLLNPEEPSLS